MTKVNRSCLVLAFLLAGAGARASAPAWKKGDLWNIQVQLDPKTSFVLHGLAAGREIVEGVPVWKVDFFPGGGAPRDLKKFFFSLRIDEKSGWPLSASSPGDKKPVDLARAGSVAFLNTVPERLPLEIFPLGPIGVLSHDGFKLVVKEHEAPHLLVVEASFPSPRGEALVRQTWVRGEKWWRDYERFIDGRPDLSAKAIGVPSILKAEEKKSGVPKKAAPAEEKPLPPFLGHDPRLRVPVSLKNAQPKLAELLDILKEATGLRFSLSNSLAGHDPDLGQIDTKTPPFAWQLMQLASHRELKDGIWERTGAGYQLSGVSLVPVPPPADSRAGLYWAVAAVGLVLLALYALRTHWSRSQTPGDSAQP